VLSGKHFGKKDELDELLELLDSDEPDGNPGDASPRHALPLHYAADNDDADDSAESTDDDAAVDADGDDPIAPAPGTDGEPIGGESERTRRRRAAAGELLSSFDAMDSIIAAATGRKSGSPAASDLYRMSKEKERTAKAVAVVGYNDDYELADAAELADMEIADAGEEELLDAGSFHDGTYTLYDADSIDAYSAGAEALAEASRSIAWNTSKRRSEKTSFGTTGIRMFTRGGELDPVRGSSQPAIGGDAHDDGNEVVQQQAWEAGEGAPAMHMKPEETAEETNALREPEPQAEPHAEDMEAKDGFRIPAGFPMPKFRGDYESESDEEPEEYRYENVESLVTPSVPAMPEPVPIPMPTPAYGYASAVPMEYQPPMEVLLVKLQTVTTPDGSSYMFDDFGNYYVYDDFGRLCTVDDAGMLYPVSESQRYVSMSGKPITIQLEVDRKPDTRVRERAEEAEREEARVRDAAAARYERRYGTDDTLPPYVVEAGKAASGEQPE
jgi:hypothetical protein